MNEAAIETAHLRQEHGDVRSQGMFVAVQDLSFSVPRGQIFGFLGPNGAGKTTAINLLLGNIKVTSGEASLLGRPVGNREARAKPGGKGEKWSTVSGEKLTQAIGRPAHQHGFEAILASSSGPSSNLNVTPQNCLPTSSIHIINEASSPPPPSHP